MIQKLQLLKITKYDLHTDLENDFRTSVSGNKLTQDTVNSG